jgi:Phytanoyl-CoA dioxygenase (PhyH)
MSVGSSLAEHGFAIVPSVLSEPECLAIDAKLASMSAEGAGSRNLLSQAWCVDTAQALRRTPALRDALAGYVAIQCTYFEKSPSMNWLVPIHQDLSIPVATRVDHPELNGWSTKEGQLYVQPPPSVLDTLVAIRLHLDDSDSDNGPLRVVPGSHRKGRLGGESHGALRSAAGEVECTVPRGGVVTLKPLVLHASSKSRSSRPRRVIHYLYGPELLPLGLSWARAA